VICKENIEAFDVWELYQLSTAHNCPQLQQYAIWVMKVQYEDIKDKSWFKKDLDQAVRHQVEQGQWPGQAYFDAVKVWEHKHKKGGKDCVVM